MSRRTQRKVVIEGQVCYGKAEALAFKALVRRARILAAPIAAKEALRKAEVQRALARYGVTGRNLSE